MQAAFCQVYRRRCGGRRQACYRVSLGDLPALMGIQVNPDTSSPWWLECRYRLRQVTSATLGACVQS